MCHNNIVTRQCVLQQHCEMSLCVTITVVWHVSLCHNYCGVARQSVSQLLWCGTSFCVTITAVCLTIDVTRSIDATIKAVQGHS